MRLEHHLVGGYVRYISPHIIIIIIINVITCTNIVPKVINSLLNSTVRWTATG